MKFPVRKILIVFCAVVFLAAGAYLAVRGYQDRNAEQAYEDAKDLAGLASPTPDAAPTPTSTPTTQPSAEPTPSADPEPTAEITPEPTPTPDPVAEALSSTDLAALQSINPDVIGWIEIPGTVLSYPLLQGEDNQYYLTHTWKGEYNAGGAIYMDYRNDPGLGDFNTILYGHRMGNGTMFNSLHEYDDPAYWEAHPAVYLVTDAGVRRYEIFAAYEADAVKKHSYRLGLVEAEGQQAFINYCTGRSVIDTGIVPEPGDCILTMSTCVGAGSGYETRWVVQAVYRDPGKGGVT